MKGELAILRVSIKFSGHMTPEINMYLTILKSQDDIGTVRREMAAAHSYGRYYGACVTGTQALWFDLFDEVIYQYKNIKIETP
jgi:hypothetical protein